MQTVYPSRAAERVLFRELFRDVATVQRNSGTLTGAPAVRDGVTLDGSSQYTTHDITGKMDGRTTMSIVLEFTPDFAYDENATRFLFDTDASNRSYFYKANNAGSNILSLQLGGTLIGNVGQGTYSAYWQQNQRNVVVISSNGSSTDIWLNGTQIMTADPTAWTAKNPVDWFTGTNASLSSKFDGEICSVTVHGCTLNQADVDAIQAGTLFDYEQRAKLWLDMAEAIIDGANDRTLDKSRHGRHFALGDGVGTGTPDFKNPGFDFNGTTDYLTNTASDGTYNNDAQTIVIACSPDFEPGGGGGGARYLFDSSSGARYFISHEGGGTLLLYMGNTQIAIIAQATYEPHWRTDGRNVLVISSESGDTDVWLNGHQILTANATVWAKQDPAAIYIGSRFSVANYFDGEIHHFSAYPFKFGQLQARDLTQRLGVNA